MASITNKLALISLLFLISIPLLIHCMSYNDFNPQQEEQQLGQEWGQKSSSENPYHFNKNNFITRVQSEEGFVKYLPRFTKRSWNLFRGLENYRFSFVEMEPNTFLVPLHWDADIVFLVLQGKGVIEFVTDNIKEAVNISKGDVVRVPAGITHFFTNPHQALPLRVAKIFVPVNIPGRLQNYWPGRLYDQQSYLSGFSPEILKASFNISDELLGSLFTGSREQPGQSMLRKVSPDQIKELTRHATSPSNKEKHKQKSKDKGQETQIISKMWRPFNLQSQEPIYSNKFGRFHEASPENFEQLQDLHVSVSYVNMTQGTLFLPQYNSKATNFVFVENGCARFEMACPHISQKQWHQQQQEQSQFQGGQEGGGEESTGEVHKIVSNVCKGELFIFPAGHPLAILSHDHDFAAVGFGINASNSTRIFLAGQENVLSNLDTVATELTFGLGNKAAEKVFRSQKFSYFVPIGKQREEEEEESPEKPKASFQSILDFAGF